MHVWLRSSFLKNINASNASYFLSINTFRSSYIFLGMWWWGGSGMRNNGENYFPLRRTPLDFSIISRVPTQSNRTRGPVRLIHVGGKQYFNGVITELFWNWWPPRKSSRRDWCTGKIVDICMQTSFFPHSFLILPSFFPLSFLFLHFT